MKGYVEVEIGGEVRGFRFGMGAYGELIDILNIGPDEIDGYMSKNPVKAIPAIIYAGAVCHAEDQGRPVGYSRHDVAEWIYELPETFNDKVVVDLIAAFTKSMERKTKGEGESSKKK